MSFLFHGKEAQYVYSLFNEMEKTDIVRNVILLLDRLCVANYLILLSKGYPLGEARLQIEANKQEYIDSIVDFFSGKFGNEQLDKCKTLFNLEYGNPEETVLNKDFALSELKSLIKEIEGKKDLESWFTVRFRLYIIVVRKGGKLCLIYIL